MTDFPRIGFIGAGNMATALVGGLLAKGWPASALMLTDVSEQALSVHAARGLRTGTDNRELVASVDIVVLAVKPQAMKAVTQALADCPQQPLYISIAAGIPAQSLAQWLGGDAAVVRAMPNTPALVQTGATGLFANAAVSHEQRVQAEQVLGAVGIALWVDTETKIDAVTAVSGSGPAYFFYLMEAMIEAGVKLGLARHDARDLALQTALGAAQMAITADVAPDELRRRVTSPKGTTEQAVAVFDAAGFADIVEQAMRACAARGVSLANELTGA
ncbi:pyrroline-5-carboxylate reductase [Paraperlucidibaca baekdonensis]|uniref:Pyrroline-5-carboxylate reductase n=1 Tax=Paraperlucidibaca baekdonensis TaxID=748120 RepID=A0A3E0H950_9GAMM|nr:pyrroline-5-carboxylate reductase [Paraperlucidibaca baekdonensis]REH40193.1 pyrroline-5-carboxylate reductase [Paraperlucidibaca baekdonensis]